ncbi:MAG: polysaccharide deacetylase family protein [Ignavibacteria bacterium]|jgi:polysaccharide deacetylase family protein (PEP-CTERM system associated)
MIIEAQNNVSAFTVDVEDGISIGMRDYFGVERPQTERVVKYTNMILDLLGKYNFKGTFFVLGKVARDFPELIKKIDTEGHEIGIHGFNHLKFNDVAPSGAFNEVSKAKNLVEDLIGKQVYGHRAPAFSINKNTEWGLDIIANAGFVYDSSVMPAKGFRYGWSNFSKTIVEMETQSGGKIIEVPLSTINFLGKEYPVCGGSYLRLYPFFITNYAFKSISENRHAILYLHPYELDTVSYPDYYMMQLKRISFFKRNVIKSNWWNRSSVYPKLEKLLSRYKFARIIDLINI